MESNASGRLQAHNANPRSLNTGRPLIGNAAMRATTSCLEVAVPGRPEERERILLDVPWELLRIASATIATGFGDPEQEYFADGTATKNSSP